VYFNNWYKSAKIQVEIIKFILDEMLGMHYIQESWMVTDNVCSLVNSRIDSL